MNLNEWRANQDFAVELKKILDLPIMKNAIDVLEKQTMAKTIGAGSGLLQLSDKAHVLFGYDAGRASLLADLNMLSVTPEEVKEIEPTYT